jgi:hypothetical protein
MPDLLDGTALDWIELHAEALERLGRDLPEPPAYRSKWHFLKQEGQEFEPAPYDSERWGFEGAERMCFHDAAELVAEHDELEYVEGIAVGSAGFAVDHAWAATEDGKVVDATWHAAFGDHGTSYWGVIVPRDILWERILERENYGVFDDPEHGYPLYKRPWSDILRAEAGSTGQREETH